MRLIPPPWDPPDTDAMARVKVRAILGNLFWANADPRKKRGSETVAQSRPVTAALVISHSWKPRCLA